MMKHKACSVIEKTMSFPAEFNRFFFIRLMDNYQRDISHAHNKAYVTTLQSTCCIWSTFDFKESFRGEGFNGFKPLYHKAKGRELTTAITDELIRERFWENLLQAQCLEPGK